MTKSTRQRAIRLLSGDKVNSDQPVYVLALHGKFSTFRHPALGKPGHLPSGHTLTVLVDAATGQITDWGISNINPGLLARLGTVRTLP